MRFAEHVVPVAVGIDARERVLGLRQGATENATTASTLAQGRSFMVD